MFDNIKFNKILPHLSLAPKVKRTDPRERNSRQTPFKDRFDGKRKKKGKDHLKHQQKSESEIALPTGPDERSRGRKGAEKPVQSIDSSRNRVIDIIV